MQQTHLLRSGGAGTIAALPCILLLLLFPLLAGCDRGSVPKEEPADTTSQKIILEDALGEKIVLQKPARRVISLGPNLTEMIYAVGGGNTLVGRTAYCNYPPEALRAEQVGDLITLNYEKVLALKPDLVLMTFTGNPFSSYKKLKELGITTVALNDTTVAGMLAAMDAVGTLLGREEGAATATAALRGTIDSIRALARSAQREPVSTFIVIDRAPLMSVTWGFLVEAIEIAGGDNIAKGGVTAYPLYSREELLRRDPEVILVPGTSRDVVAELLRLYPEWGKLRAVRENRVYVIHPDLIIRPGPRFAEGLKLLYQALHGADPETLLQEGE